MPGTTTHLLGEACLPQRVTDDISTIWLQTRFALLVRWEEITKSPYWNFSFENNCQFV